MNSPVQIVGSAVVACTVAVVFTSTACTVGGEPTPVATELEPKKTTSKPIRQTDDNGRNLPFSTPFPNRWSRNNNGTKYEPCTALTDAELVDAGLDPRSVSDIALADGQTARGCQWDHADSKQSGISQGTGDAPTFEEQMADRDWYKRSWDIRVYGRLVMVDYSDIYTCATTVKSGRSPVSTIVVRITDAPPMSELCDIAIDFTRRTIPKMEPPARS
ncbi:MAG: DUF3558 domain-containing protein [Gordonia amarae]